MIFRTLFFKKKQLTMNFLNEIRILLFFCAGLLGGLALSTIDVRLVDWWASQPLTLQAAAMLTVVSVAWWMSGGNYHYRFHVERVDDG